MSTNNYLSTKLSEISVEADSIVSLHLNTLDRISNDIKALESALKNAAIPFTFVYIIASEREIYKTYSTPYSDWLYAEITCNTDYGLVWGRSNDGHYRLLYNQYGTEDVVGYYDYEGHRKKSLDGEPNLVSSKPLIETKANIRIQIERELPEFYAKIIEALKTKPGEERVVMDSPNYKGFCSSVCFTWDR